MASTTIDTTQQEFEQRSRDHWRATCPLRQLRRAHGMSQASLACVAGLSVGTVESAELGRRRPRLDTVATLAKALGVDVGEFASLWVNWLDRRPQ